MREAAQNRAEGEDDDRGAKHAPRAKAIRRPAGERDEDRERQQIGGERELQRHRVFMQIGRHGRQGGGEHGAVELLHEQRGGDDERRDDELEGDRLASQRSARATPRTASNQLQPLEARLAVAPDDQMIVHGDAERLGDGDDVPASCGYRRSRASDRRTGDYGRGSARSRRAPARGAPLRADRRAYDRPCRRPAPRRR